MGKLKNEKLILKGIEECGFLRKNFTKAELEEIDKAIDEPDGSTRDFASAYGKCLVGHIKGEYKGLPYITIDEFRNRVLKNLRKCCSNGQGELHNQERFDECVEKHLEYYLEASYQRYKSELEWSFSQENLTFEAYTEATINQCVSCLELEY